ncbi:hypothetical protein [Acinetobacter haemolyticus]|uniref:hypothetical protein n=1 Tax=Acinetobacter haemolyticus TaxID=29430 RepID=UPI001331E2C4|nr:hypothetical protein [Acinetobacter haemolyticus]QHI17110.1 hypothetical protein AhaeAN4_11190 [Acinetobacter haemolyticus]
MDIQIRKQLEQLEYIKDKLEYIEYDEALGCYIEKQDGLPTGVAAWVNGAFYGFEQAAKALAVPDGFVVVPKEPTPKMIDSTWNYDDEIQEMSHNTRNEFIYKAMIEAQEPAND